MQFLQRWRWWLRLLGVSALIGLVLLFQVDLGETFTLIVHARPEPLALAVLGFVPFLATKAWRWQIILRDLGVAIPFRQALHLYALGLGAATLTPGQVGDAIKIAYFRERGFGQAILSVILDRLWDVLILALLAAMGALLFVQLFEGEWLAIGLMLLGTATVFTLVNHPRTQRRLFAALTRRRKTDDAFASYEPRPLTPRQLGVQLGVSALATLIVYARFWLLAVAVGVILPPVPFVATVSLASIAALLPFSFFGGLGTRDAALLLIAPLIGLSGAQALAFSTLILLIQLVNGVVGLGVWLFEPKAGSSPIVPAQPRSAIHNPSSAIRVLMLTSSYPKFRGDTTAPFIESIATHLAALGVEVHVVLPEHRELKRGAVEDGVHFHPYRYAPRRCWTMWGYAESLRGDVELRRGAYALAPLALSASLQTLLALTARVKFDVLHAHWVLPNGPAAALAAQWRRLPLIVSLHGSDVFLAERNRGFGLVARWCFARAARLTACSMDLMQRAQVLGADETKIEWIPYGADAKAFRVPPGAAQRVRQELHLHADEVMILAVGRMVYKKGFEFLIAAMPEILEEAPQARLVLVGYGDLQPALEEQVRVLGLNASVIFAGRVERDQIPAYYAAADIVVVPSVRDTAGNVDGLPNVALEAMAAGKPLVASNIAGFPDVVRDGESGFLVPEKNPSALAEAVLRLARDPALRLRLGEAARTQVHRTLNWENVARRYLEVYERVLR